MLPLKSLSKSTSAISKQEQIYIKPFRNTLREEIFAGINFRELFFGHFVGINFRELGFTEDFAGINFRELILTKNFAGINFRKILG